MVSKMRDMGLDICMISPLIRQSFLLSSRTVFMFSIHKASIGPSNTTHLRSGVSVDANSRKVLATIPSVHWKWWLMVRLCKVKFLITEGQLWSGHSHKDMAFHSGQAYRNIALNNKNMLLITIKSHMCIGEASTSTTAATSWENVPRVRLGQTGRRAGPWWQPWGWWCGSGPSHSPPSGPARWAASSLHTVSLSPSFCNRTALPPTWSCNMDMQ